MLKIYMVDEVDNITEFETIEDTKRFVKTEDPKIANYATFYRAPAGLFVATRIAAEGSLLGYGYQILN